jgi:TonB family protein
MEWFYNNIIESALSLGVFTLVYWLFLRKETRLKANRIYLLVALFVSTLLPYITFNIDFVYNVPNTIQASEATNLQTNLLETITVVTNGIPQRVGTAWMAIEPLAWIYGIGGVLVLAMVVIGLIQLLSMVLQNRKYNMKRVRLIISGKDVSPYSFFNFIFIHRELPRQTNWKAIVYHELEHVRQGHSLDILFVDAMMIFQWFNPFYWIIRRLVQENHEFLADRAVLNRGSISTGQYKQLLLSQAMGGAPLMVSNFFSVKTIQKRFKMITNYSNKKPSFLKYGSVVALALVLCMLFAVQINTRATIVAQPIENQVISDEAVRSEQTEVLEIEPAIQRDSVKVEKNTNEVFMVVEDMPEFPGGEDSLRSFINRNVKYPVAAAEKGIQGKVFISFIVGKDGKVELPKVARGVDSSLDTEALRVVSLLPTWKPGLQKGKAVRVSYTVPINFRLNDSSENTTAPTTPKTVDPNQVFMVVEDMPEFPGGENALRTFINTNVQYPVAVAENGIQGKVFVEFIIGKDGKVESQKIARSVDPALDAEALRVVGSLPKWKPGMQKGQPVRVSYTVPINFQLH